MKRRLAVLFVGIITAFCLLCMVGCGDPNESYSFTGSGDFSGRAVNVTLDCAADKTVTATASFGEMELGKWTGSWKKNSDKTLTVEFTSKDSTVPVPEAMAAAVAAVTLNEEHLTLQSELNGDVHTLKFFAFIVAGNYPLPLEATLTQVVKTAE